VAFIAANNVYWHVRFEDASMACWKGDPDPLADAGLAELRRWLLETEPDRYPRSEALLRIFLLGALSRDQAREYIERLGRKAGDDVAALEAFEASIAWDNDDDLQLHGRLVLDSGKRLWVMSQEWGQWAAEQIPAQKKAPQKKADNPPA
jgi:PadR family transcriptional regulator AphA